MGIKHEANCLQCSDITPEKSGGKRPRYIPVVTLSDPVSKKSEKNSADGGDECICRKMEEDKKHIGTEHTTLCRDIYYNDPSEGITTAQEATPTSGDDLVPRKRTCDHNFTWHGSNW